MRYFYALQEPFPNQERATYKLLRRQRVHVQRTARLLDNKAPLAELPDDLRHFFLKGLRIGSQVNFRIFWRLVRIIDASEIFDFTCPCFFVEPFWISRFCGF